MRVLFFIINLYLVELVVETVVSFLEDVLHILRRDFRPLPCCVAHLQNPGVSQIGEILFKTAKE